jgi:hypothetical protein
MTLKFLHVQAERLDMRETRRFNRQVIDNLNKKGRHGEALEPCAQRHYANACCSGHPTWFEALPMTH